MKHRYVQPLTGAGVAAGAAVLSAFFFVAFLAPGWPRTAWEWAISAALGLPLLVLAEMILAVCFSMGPPRFRLVRRLTPSGMQVFRYRAGSRTAQAVVVAVRILAAAALFGAAIWALVAFLHLPAVRAQFR
ncbi:MAG TPA: hypothetical protein VF092_16295 [Longimicrobium sp.]